ncbi:MAG: ShlB/FhaC/HecB family hemolysin secretion/activation protein [Gammaproteobacteria bacterium]|jgi:hemolysin activation/secretion protein
MTLKHIYKLHFFLFLMVNGLALVSGATLAADEDTDRDPVLESVPDASPQRGLKKKRPTESDKPEPRLDVAPQGPDAGRKVLPDVSPPSGASNQLSVMPTVNVNTINLQGNTVIPPKELAAIIEPYEHKSQSFEALNGLRHKLSQYYLQKGYVNSGVIIPDQKIENGIVTFQAIEGELSSIELQGLQRLDASYVKSRIRAVVSGPLNVNDLSEALKMLNQNPLIAQINARLLPGDKLGQSQLKVAVKEDDAFYYSIGADNYLSPSAGAERLTINAGHGNVFGVGDTIDAEVDLTEGLSGLGLLYSIPFSGKGSSFNVFGDYRDYIVVEEPFDAIDIESHSTKFGFAIEHPFINRLNETLTGSVGFEVKHSESTLSGVPFSFSLGEIDGKSDVSVVDLTLGWVRRYPDQVYSLQGSLRFGVNALDATDNQGDLPDGEFSLVRGQFQFAHLLGLWRSQVLFRTGFQLANDPLLSLEKYAVGGRYTVRGYRENQYVRDSGATVTLEWRIPLLAPTNSQQLNLVPFADYGSSWDENEELTGTEKASISSVGIGLLYDSSENLHMELYWGAALDDVPEPSDSNIQDDGIHFQVVYHSRN